MQYIKNVVRHILSAVYRVLCHSKGGMHPHCQCAPQSEISKFCPIIKQSTISPLLKKWTNGPQDKDQLPNYHLISNLSLISKIIEHVFKSCLIDFSIFQ